MRRDFLPVLAEHYEKGAETRGEMVLVIAPPAESEAPDAAALDAIIRNSLQRLSLKDAVSEIAQSTGIPRRDVYQRALALAKEK